MQGEHDKILRMVEEGTISAEEAQELFEAMEEYEVESIFGEETRDAPETLGSRDIWRRPFSISLIVATIGWSLLLRTRRSTGLLSLVRAVILFPVTLIAALAAVITYLSKEGPWLHVRVRSAEGERISVRLPFPTHIIRRGLMMAREQVADGKTSEKIDVAAEFLEALETSNLRDPVSIDVMDEGNNVQIFLG